MNNNKKLIITHLDDTDGMGGAILGKLIDPNIDIKLAAIHDLPNIISSLIKNNQYEQYKAIYIVDLPLNPKLFELINSHPDFYRRIAHFDHHTSYMIPKECNWSTTIYERNGFKPSGTSLFHEYLLTQYPNHPLLNHPYTIDLVETIRSYDTWDWKKTNNLTARDLTYLLQRLGPDRFIDYFYRKILHVNKTNEISKVEYNETEQLLINTVIEEIANHIKECDRLLQPVIFENYSVGYITTERHRSDVGNELSEKYKDKYHFIMLYDPMRQSMSLRTVRDDVDLAVLARKYGGGGIPKAAGFPVSSVVLSLITPTNMTINVEVGNIFENVKSKGRF